MFRDDSKNEIRLRTLVETVVYGVILIDSQGIIFMFNPACERLFGYRAEEVIGQNVKILMPTPFHEEHDQYLHSYREGGERKIIGIGREVAGRRKNGSTFPMDLSVGEAKQAGETIFVGIIHDLTERKNSERVLLETASRLQAVVETAVDGVILIDTRGNVQMFNPACERLFGYSAEEVIGQNVKLLMPTPFHEEHDQYLANYRETGERKIIGIGREVVGRRKDGTTFPMDLSVGEARQEGEPIFVGIIHDLTERKRTSQQLVQAQKMETVGQLSGGIAHDFNNLLTVIIGNSDILSEKLKARPDLKQYCDGVINAGMRGAELTRRLLAFSRRQELQPTVINCNQLVEGMRVLLQRTLREDIDIRIVLRQQLMMAYADPAQLESAILNLALNAQDAMPLGGTLALITENALLDERYQDGHPEVTPGGYVSINVTDDGTGMTPEIKARVFEPFFTTKDVGKGSGLGLSMVYGFIKQSNGHVAIYSEPGLGTTVRLYLPAAKIPKQPVAEDSGPAVDPELRGIETVLVIEDDSFVRGYAVGTLESLGYRVIVAGDGQEGIAKLRQYGEQIDVLFSDIVMPGGLGGWELAERAQELQPGVKILLTSGYPLETMTANFRPNIKSAILHKPYRKADLALRLREILDQK
jgi:PAS domain S-box-containing protein